MATRNLKYLRQEVIEFGPAFFSLIFFSFFITILFLTPSIYVIQLQDRVLQSRNTSTLISLGGIMIFLVAVWSLLEWARERILDRVAYAIDQKIAPRVFDALNRQTDKLSGATRGLVLQDLNLVREFLSGPLAVALLDLLWVPLIILVAFVFHFWIGIAIACVTVLSGVLATATRLLSRYHVVGDLNASAQTHEFGRAVMGSSEMARVMGMLPRLKTRWSDLRDNALGWVDLAKRRTAIVRFAARFVRHLYMPFMLTIGALLVLASDIGAGAMFATSLLALRTLLPIDSVSTGWRTVSTAFLAAGRLDDILHEAAKRPPRVSLPRPEGPLVISRVAATPQNKDLIVLNDVSFSVSPGRIVGVVGASGAGKSSLGRVLVGAWPLARGSITLAGHELSHWDQDKLGAHIGYVPQDVDMLSGTVADNISRFEPSGPETDTRLIAAVNLANIKDIIAKLPHGLNTRLGPDGYQMSSGQRQRVALARAVYGEPMLLVLDEPNSNLDAQGEQSLTETIRTLRERGSIVILITHRMNMLGYCDHVLVMNNGTVHAFGEREQIVNRLASNQAPKQLPNRSASGGGPIAA